MQLSDRLTAVASLCTKCSALADIGTDHGYIPIFLCQNEIVKTALAMDVNQGPLERADQNIRSYCLEESISTRLSDGLRALKPGEVDAIVVAGMGGALTIKILEEGREAAKELSYMVLQPQSEIHLVRRYLYRQGYTIVKEDMVLEDGKYYPMMRVENAAASDVRDAVVLKEGNDTAELSEAEYYFGPHLLRQKHPVLKQFVEKELDSLKKLEGTLATQDSERSRIRLGELMEKKQLLLQALEICS